MNEQIWWYTTHASGIVAWVLLTASVIWGIVLATDLFPRRRRPAWLLDLHRWLGGLTMGFLVIHLAALLADSWIEFTLVDFVVPMASEWKPVPVALGVVALWGLVVVQVTSMVMRKLPRRAWRSIHLTSYLTFWLTSLHGTFAGTDATQPMYVASSSLAVTAVIFFALYRILSMGERQRSHAPGGFSPPAAHPSAHNTHLSRLGAPGVASGIGCRFGPGVLFGLNLACELRRLLSKRRSSPRVAAMVVNQPPLGVDVYRGDSVESRHQVHAVVASADEVRSAWGNADRPTMPRSAIKSIQLLPMLASGAAKAFGVTDDEVALAASSHNAEPVHTAAVAAWLERLGLGVPDLECGPSDPIHAATTRALYARGGEPTPLHNCCSGKHTGFLTLLRHLEDRPGFSLPGYREPNHGVQLLVRDAQAAMTGVDLGEQTPVIDGCGIPVFQFPLRSLAQAMARLVTPDAVPQQFAGAAARVVKALPPRSYLVSGEGRADHLLSDAANEPIIIKGGAEGVSMGALPERGIGFALKCEDGNGRGVNEALGAMLHRLDVTDAIISPNAPIRNRAGTEVGHFTVRF